MHISGATFTGFKRFTQTTIQGIPAAARLVVLAGPNGSGKSSIFDGFRTWHGLNGSGAYWDEDYGHKVGEPPLSWPQHVQVAFHESLPVDAEERKRLIYIRTAFRNEADFSVQQIQRLSSPLDAPRISRMIDNDTSVSSNYQRMVMQTIDGLYGDDLPDESTKGFIRDRIIGEVRDAVLQVFPDLTLAGIGSFGGVNMQGAFYFNKGASRGFLYKNLSAGEKAAFDLILDMVVMRPFYNNTVWCIDEPETHLNTRIQGALLQTLVDLLPANCQLWIASHSIGFMRKAWELARQAPSNVAFLDLQDRDFDAPVVLEPIRPTREFWSRTLDVALGDMANLLAPERVVLCEGKPRTTASDDRAAFDAECYRTIFADEFPGVAFFSVGSATEVAQDHLELGAAITALVAGTRVDRVIDRDDRSDHEVELLAQQGVRVLQRRHIEGYLFDPEVIEQLCVAQGRPEQVQAALALRDEAVRGLVERGRPSDDVKAAATNIRTGLQRLLGLVGSGSTSMAFGRDTLAPLIRPGMSVYAELRQDVLNE